MIRFLYSYKNDHFFVDCMLIYEFQYCVLIVLMLYGIYISFNKKS